MTTMARDGAGVGEAQQTGEATQTIEPTIAKPRAHSADRAAALFAVFALLFTSGCGGFFVYPGSTGSGSGGSTTGDYVYVANAATSNLAGFAVGTGTLTAVSGSPYTLPISPTALAINPANTILYVAGGTSIYAYSIASTGALSVLNGGSPVAAATVASMDISPDGQWLIGLDKTAGVIDEYQINASTGTLTAHSATYSAAGTIVPTAIKVAPNAQYVFASIGTAGDLAFPFSTSTGTLSTPTQLVPPAGTSDNALAVDPNTTYLYIARSGTGGGLAVYAIGLGGALGAVTGSPFAASSQPASERAVILNKAGTDVYIANYTDDAISGFSIGSGAALTAISGSPYAAGSLVNALAVDNSGNYLLAAAANGSPDLALYSYDATTAGKLDLSASTATGADPTDAIAIAATH